MRRIGKFTCQILPGEVEILVHILPPLGAIGHIIDDAVMGDVLTRAAVAVGAAEFHFCDNMVGDDHDSNYTRYWIKRKSGACFESMPRFC